MCGEVRKDWRSSGAALEMTALDLKSACKQLALSPLDNDKTVVTIKNPSDDSIECYLMNVLPFGASASVLHFLRVSTSTRWDVHWVAVGHAISTITLSSATL